jgi:FkbM family methyltransferase
MAARQRHPDAVIHAYEPNQRALSYLTTNTANLNIEIFAEAVGSCSGRARMLDTSDINLATAHPDSGGETIQVALDKVIQRIGGCVDFLKLDCEGCEWELFECADSWSKVQSLRMEYHLGDGRSLESVEAALQRLGFRITKRLPCQGFGIVWADRPLNL